MMQKELILPDDKLVACTRWLNQLWNLQLQTNIHEKSADCHQLRVYTFGNIIPVMQKGNINIHSLFPFTLTAGLHFAPIHVQNEVPHDQNQMCCVQNWIYRMYACMHASMYLCMYGLVYMHVICMYMICMYLYMYLCIYVVCVCNK